MADIQIVSAYYGRDDEENRGKVMAALQNTIEDFGRLAVPGNFNEFFGFDPIPGEPKHLNITVRVNGAEHSISAREGDAVLFPCNIQVADAWYGHDNFPEQKAASAPQVIARVREAAARGRIDFAGNINQWVGFDPLDGHRKTLYLSLVIEGERFETRLDEDAHVAIPTSEFISARLPGDSERGRWKQEKLRQQQEEEARKEAAAEAKRQAIEAERKMEETARAEEARRRQEEQERAQAGKRDPFHGYGYTPIVTPEYAR